MKNGDDGLVGNLYLFLKKTVKSNLMFPCKLYKHNYVC